MTIRIDFEASNAAGVPNAVIAACVLNETGDHEWIAVTTMTDTTLKYLCVRCNARGIDEKDWRPMMNDERTPAGRLATAIRLAAAAHRDQTDKAGAPYILHPIRVMMALERTTVDRMIVAVLHDTVEDTDVALPTIRTLFGNEVADAVEALTKRDGESYDHFIDRCSINAIARDVKRQDIRDNMDADRLAILPADERERLIAKYSAALHRINGTTPLHCNCGASATDYHASSCPLAKYEGIEGYERYR